MLLTRVRASGRLCVRCEDTALGEVDLRERRWEMGDKIDIQKRTLQTKRGCRAWWGRSVGWGRRRVRTSLGPRPFPP